MSIFNPELLYNSQNVKKTKQLFWEFADNKDEAILTIGKKDNHNCKSLYQLYLKYAIDDPTEVQFALDVFGDVAFWFNLRQSHFVKVHIQKWEEEVEKIRLSRNISHIIEATQNEKTKLQAAKFLLEHGSRFRPGHSDGRKERAQNKERIEEVLESEAFAEDIKRLNPLFN